MTAFFTIIVRLSDGETWAQMSKPGSPRELLEWPTETEARAFLNEHWPSHIRPDVFHGLQPLRIAQVNRKGST